MASLKEIYEKMAVRAIEVKAANRKELSREWSHVTEIPRRHFTWSQEDDDHAFSPEVIEWIQERVGGIWAIRGGWLGLEDPDVIVEFKLRWG